MRIKSIFSTTVSSGTMSVGLLILRLGVGLGVFVKHGIEKLTGYSAMAQNFPDPLHIGVHASLTYALLSDGICSMLVALGLATRPAALIVLINVTTAFFFVHHADFMTHANGNGGEIDMLYMIAFAAFIVTGPGKFSADSFLNRS